MRSYKICVFSVMAFVIFVGAGFEKALAGMQDTWAVVLRPKVSQSTHTTLSDVVVSSETNVNLLKRYGAIQIPVVNEGEPVQPAQVIMALDRSGVDISRVVIRKSTEIDEPRPEQDSGEEVVLIEESIRQQAIHTWNCSEDDLSIELGEMPQALPPRRAFTKVRVDMPKQENLILAKLTFQDADQHIIAESEIPLTIRVKSSVLVLKTTIAAGKVITPGDVRMEKRLLENESYFHSIAQLEKTRFQAKEALEVGRLLSKDDVTALADLQVGSIVTLIAKGSQLQVKAVGRVKELLDNGTMVSVENTDSKKVILGKPLSANEVEVVF